MVGESHAERRNWAFEALDALQAFTSDPDFQGDAAEERALLERRRAELRESKYRVVVIGAFNVGKSTLINAFLGDEYLPRILEECTAKVTHVVRGEPMSIVLRMDEPATDAELATLRDLTGAAGTPADVSRGPQGADVTLAFESTNPKALRNTLNALITVGADEEYPSLRSLRGKFGELLIHLPNPRLAEDIAWVDSPGVYSINETERTVAHDIIPNSHLVICMLDSQHAGAEQNRDFIREIVADSQRKIFFVINKADQLNPEEIDPAGRRGPAKDLMRSLSGVVEDAELFFVSSLYALYSAQLASGRLTMADLERDNKVRLPMSVMQDLTGAEDREKAVADYLWTESRFGRLYDRALEYLYGENREGAVVENTCKFLADQAWRYTRPLQARLDVARDVPRLEDLARRRQTLTRDLEYNRARTEQVLTGLEAVTQGGEFEGRPYPGYKDLVEKRLTSAAVEEEVLKPLREWLASSENLKRAKRERYRPLTAQVEARLDAFVERTLDEINREVEAVEGRIRAWMRPVAPGPETLEMGRIEAPRANIALIEGGMGGSYALFGLIGLIVGAAAGAAIGAATHVDTLVNLPMPLEVSQPGAVLGGVAGAVLGLLAGLIARASGSDDARREKLGRQFTEKVNQMLLHDLREQLLSRLERRRVAFTDSVRQGFDHITRNLEDELEQVRREEDELRRDQDQVVNRLEPKIQSLTELMNRARACIDGRTTALDPR